MPVAIDQELRQESKPDYSIFVLTGLEADRRENCFGELLGEFFAMKFRLRQTLGWRLDAFRE
ncbi:MAG: hypothetical protein ABSA85_11835 [Terracidiphilus sp.]